MRSLSSHSGTEQSEVAGIHNRGTGDMDSGLATLSRPGMTGSKKSPAEIPWGFFFDVDYREENFLRMILSENRKTTFRDHALSVLGRPGSVLLFQALRLSTIGAEDFDGRVRNGIG